MTEAKLISKLSKIMGKIDRIPKNGFNSFHKYYYATEADVADHCRKFMSEEKVMIVPTIKSVVNIERTDKDGKKTNDITRLFVNFTFYDGDSDEKISIDVVGDAQDSSDKGIYKAFTGAQKYALMKTFLIPTGDDPEREGDDKKGRGKDSAKHQNPEEKDVPVYPVPEEEKFQTMITKLTFVEKGKKWWKVKQDYNNLVLFAKKEEIGLLAESIFKDGGVARIAYSSDIIEFKDGPKETFFIHDIVKEGAA